MIQKNVQVLRAADSRTSEYCTIDIICQVRIITRAADSRTSDYYVGFDELVVSYIDPVRRILAPLNRL